MPASRIAIQPDSKAANEYVENICEEEQELIDSFAVFDEEKSGTIHAKSCLRYSHDGRCT